MNRILRFLFLVIMVMAGTCCYATNYDLWVAGVRVTDQNASDVFDDGGTVRYNPSSNVLTLENATIVNSEASFSAIAVGIDGLEIN